MNLKKALLGIAAALTIGAAAQTAQSATICNGCNYVDGGAATYLGAHNAGTSDVSTFQHIFNPSISGTDFGDYWVFDIAPAAFGSASADFTVTTRIANFAGSLHFDGGSVCAGGPGTACASMVLGAQIASDTANGGRDWEIVFNLAPGRYILHITGQMRENSAYTGQISFIPRFVPEPDVLVLLAVGLIAAGFTARRRSA